MTFSQLPAFDLRHLSSETVRATLSKCAGADRRGGGVFYRGYKPAGTPATLAARYVQSPEFNASTWIEGDATVIGLSAAIIPLPVDAIFGSAVRCQRVAGASGIVQTPGEAEAQGALLV